MATSPAKERFHQKQQAAAMHPKMRRLVAIHNELAQQHTRAANAAKNADHATYVAAFRHIQRLLDELNATFDKGKEVEGSS